jgi:RNA polymerase sigma-70 factor (ECF subfamily)
MMVAPKHDSSAVATPPTDGETSFELVQRACAGDRDAEERICERYLPRLRRWARGRLPRGARPALQTDDVVQEVLSRAIRSFTTFAPRHEGSFPAYLRTILANKLRDLGRIDQRRPPPTRLETGMDAPSPDLTPFDEAVGTENRARFEEAFDRLSPEDQELIFMRLELGYAYEEIAAMLGRATPNAIRIAARRAMLRLAKEMSRERASV